MTQQIPGAPWYDSPVEWSTLELGGKIIPGDATIRIRRGNKWDRKDAKGEHGEEQEYNGARAADVDITIRLRTTEQYDAFQLVLPDFEPDPGKKEQKPYDIVHPTARSRKVRSICIDDIDGPNIDGQFAVYQFSCFEHRPRSSKNAKGTAKGGSVSNECAEQLRHYEALLSDWATAPTPEAQRAIDFMLDTQYQVLVALGCENHAPPAGNPVGFEETEDPDDPKAEEKDPVDAIIDALWPSEP